MLNERLWKTFSVSWTKSNAKKYYTNFEIQIQYKKKKYVTKFNKI